MFEHLDDANAPEPTALLDDVHSRADRRRRKRLLASTTALALVCALAVGGIAVFAGGNDEPNDISTPGPDSSTTSTPAPVVAARPVSEADTPDGLHLRLELLTPVVSAGNDVRAELTVRNDSDADRTFGGSLGCFGVLPQLLRDGEQVTRNDVVACRTSARILKPGADDTWPVRFAATVDPGVYAFVLRAVRPDADFDPELLEPLPVTVVNEDVKANFDLDDNTVKAGDKLSGYIVIENGSGKPIPLGTSCAAKWAVMLESDEIPAEFAFTMECGAPTESLPVGETRWPFTVQASYSFCSNDSPLPADQVACLPGNDKMPPLPTGDYRLVMGWRDDAVFVPEPVPVTVTPAATTAAVNAARAHFEFDDRAVEAGGKLSGELVIDNDGDEPLQLGRSCAAKWAFGLERDEISANFAFTEECGTDFQTVPVGETRWPVTVEASYPTCDDTGASKTVRCPVMPPLPPGEYRLVMGWSEDMGLTPEPITVTVTSSE